ncbi:MAG: GntR family transcriptional regulator [Acidimicrobiales bacterium]
MKPPALVDWAYRSIKDAILNLEIAPGTQLRAEELAQNFGISRTPVREALLRLEQDGLVRTVARVGTFVAEITASDVAELFELRGLLESHAAKKAAGALSEEALVSIDRLLAEGATAVGRGDLKGFQTSEIEFHDHLLRAAGNRRLLAVMSLLRDLTHRQRALSLGVRDNVEQSLAEHRAVAAALRRRDAEAAGQLMAAHLGAARDRLLASAELPP